MAATPYKPISWYDNDPLFTDKLNAMTNNDQWLFENSASMYYNAYSLKRTTGIKIACGMTLIPSAKSSWASALVYFGDFFSAGCHPVIVTGLVHQWEIRIHHGVRGIGTMHPDQRGFTISVSTDIPTATSNYISKFFYVSWIAMGY